MVGHRFVEALRSRDIDGDWRVTVARRGADAAYDRVGLTGYTEHWDRTRLALPGNDYAGDDRVELILRDRVTRIDTGRQVRHDDARPPHLLRRAGARHRLVRVRTTRAGTRPAGVPRLPHAWTTSTPSGRTSMRATDAGVTGGVVIGGGLLGLEAANALRGFGLHPHVVERSPRLMNQQLDRPVVHC